MQPVSAVACPSCATVVPISLATFPFCSSRCRAGDLAGWFAERYAVAGPSLSDRMAQPVDPYDDDEAARS